MKRVALKRPRPHSLFHNSGAREARRHSRHLHKSTFLNGCRTRITVRKVGKASSFPWMARSPSSSSTVRNSTQTDVAVLFLFLCFFADG